MDDHHIQAVSLFLRNAGETAPLFVDLGVVFGTGTAMPWPVLKKRLEKVESVVKLVVPRAKQIRVLERIFLEHFMRYFSFDTLCQLKEISVCDRETTMNGSKTARMQKDPFPQSLEKLSIWHASLDLARVPLPSSISELIIQDPIGKARLSVALSLDLFSQLPHLRICHLDITRPRFMSPFPLSDSIMLEELEEIHLTWRGENMNIGDIFKVLRFPKLDVLFLNGMESTSMPWEDIDFSLSLSDPPLRVLTIIGDDVVPPVFLNIPGICNELVSLTLANLTITSEILEALALNTKSPPLLPNLRFLDLHCCKIQSFTSLVRMLKSRADGVVSGNKLDCFRLTTGILSIDRENYLRECGIRDLVICNTD